MSRNVCITAVDGQTGFAIAELLLTAPQFSKKIGTVVGMSLHPQSAKAKEAKSLGVKIVTHAPGRERAMAKALKDTDCDTLCLIPPAHKEKFAITEELVGAAKKAGIPNVLFISSAGCDYADPQRQPRLREFIDLEALVLSAKGDDSMETGHSPVVIRAGFYAENLLAYTPQVISENILPLPIGPNHKFAPVALGDVAHVAAHVLSGQGDHGFDDRHRGQMMVITGPMLGAGEELAAAASKALGLEISFEDISPAEAKKVLQAQSDSDASEIEYILEFYSLVREGKMNYISTTAFHDVTGHNSTQPDTFFELYAQEFHPKKKVKRSHP